MYPEQPTNSQILATALADIFVILTILFLQCINRQLYSFADIITQILNSLSIVSMVFPVLLNVIENILNSIDLVL